MRYHLKKGIIFLLVATALLMAGCSKEESTGTVPETADTSVVMGEPEGSKGTDVVLVMDESGSMVKADRERIAIEGAKMFIDMEKVSGINVALVEFSNQIASTDLIGMGQQQNKEYMKSMLDSVQYGSTAHTDTGAGLLEAISILDGAKNDNNKAIILFTDGKTDIDVGTPGRTTEDSLKDVDLAVAQAVEKKYTIYCIGLNADGSVDEAELGKMAISTGGQYHIAMDVNELPDFFNQIFADIDDSEWKPIDEFDADGDYRDVHFSIDNGNVMEANIVILSSQQVEDVTLIDNQGDQVDLDSNDKAIFTNSSRYSLVKLIYPEMGDWSISVKGVSGDHIKIGLIYNYDVSLMVEADKTSVVCGGDINLKAYLASGGQTMEDSGFYGNMTGYYSAKNLASGEVVRGELALNEEGNRFVGIFTPSEAASYHMLVHLEGNGFYRDSEQFVIEATIDPVIIKKVMPEQELKVGKTKEIDLDEYFEDQGGDGISYSLSETGEMLHGEVDGSLLKLTAGQTGETNITIYADNGSSETRYLNVAVKSIGFTTQLFRVLAPVLVVLLLLLLILLALKGKEKITGIFKVTIESSKADEYGAAETVSYPIINTIPASSVGKRYFTIEKLLSLVQGYYLAMEFDAEKKEAFSQCMNFMMPEAGKVKVQGSKKPFEIKLVNKSPKVQFTNMDIINENKTLLISIADSPMGITPVMEKEFGIRFLAEESDYVQVNIVYRKM